MIKRTTFLSAFVLLTTLSSFSSPVYALISAPSWIELGCDGEDTAWSYVLLAEGIVFVGAGSEVKSGDVGANSVGNGQVTVSVGPNAKVSTGSKVKGDYIRLKARSEVGDVYYNRIKKDASARIHGNKYTPICLPVASLPPFPSFSPGKTNVKVNMGKAQTLGEGSYGCVTVMPGARLIFTGGIYNLKSLTAHANTKLYFNAQSEVRIQENMHIGVNSDLAPNTGSSIDASDIIFYVKGNAAVEGVNSDVEANIYAPRGTIWLQANMDATGAYIGKKIFVGVNVDLTWDSAFAHYAKADKLCLHFYNDGTFAYFSETLVAEPDPSMFTYVVYLDKPAGGAYSQDFRLVYSQEIAELQSWDGASWTYVEDITVTVDARNIVFCVSLSSIANPDIQEDTKVWFVEYQGSGSYQSEVDRAPNTGSYFISYEVIPELPWPTPLFFIPAVTATVYFTYRRRFKQDG